jgi:hypothetical protein
MELAVLFSLWESKTIKRFGANATGYRGRILDRVD